MHNEFPDYLGGSDFDDESDYESSEEQLQERVENLEHLVGELQSKLEVVQSAGIGLYGLGTTIAVVVSWSRNASILWCILHGVLSWAYVIYFAITR